MFRILTNPSNPSVLRSNGSVCCSGSPATWCPDCRTAAAAIVFPATATRRSPRVAVTAVTASQRPDPAPSITSMLADPAPTTATATRRGNGPDPAPSIASFLGGRS